jgi:hypothetical protein
MTTEQKARQLMVEGRQQEQNLQERLLTRSVEEVEVQSVEETEAKARELMVEERQQEETRQETMLSRAEAEIQ